MWLLLYNPIFDITKINGSFGITQVLLLSGSFCIDDVPFEVLLKFRDTDTGATISLREGSMKLRRWWVGEPAKIGIQKNIVISLYTDISIIFRTWGLRKIWMAKGFVAETILLDNIESCFHSRGNPATVCCSGRKGTLRPGQAADEKSESWVALILGASHVSVPRRRPEISRAGLWKPQIGHGQNRILTWLYAAICGYGRLGEKGPLLSLESGSKLWEKFDCLFCFGEVEAVSWSAVRSKDSTPELDRLPPFYWGPHASG